MATRIDATEQSLDEIRTHFADFTDDLPTGVTVTSASATHIPPSGTAATPTVAITLAPIVSVTLGPLAVTGTHQLQVIAALSDGELSEMLLYIPVKF
jgi:hypothetical protein